MTKLDTRSASMGSEIHRRFYNGEKNNELHIYIYGYLCIYIYIYIYMCVNIYIFLCKYVRIFIYLYIYINIYINILIYMHMYIHICICIYIYTYIHTNIKERPARGRRPTTGSKNKGRVMRYIYR